MWHLVATIWMIFPKNNMMKFVAVWVYTIRSIGDQKCRRRQSLTPDSLKEKMISQILGDSVDILSFPAPIRITNCDTADAITGL